METINDLQEMTRTALLLHGANRHPLTALAEIYETLGRIVRLTQLTPKRKINSENEFASIYLTTIGIANQYCVDLAAAYKTRGLPKYIYNFPILPENTDAPALPCLIDASGRLSETINNYENSQNSNQTEHCHSLSQAIAECHYALLLYAREAKINFMSAVILNLQKKYDWLKHSYKRYWDPSNAKCLNRFRDIAKKTQCIFAPRAKLWGSPDYKCDMDIATNIKASVPSLERFTRICRKEQLDGYVIELRDKQHFSNISQFCDAFNATLKTLSTCDPKAERCMEKDIFSPEWRFRFNSETFFITTFAPFYNRSHPRYSENEHSAFVFLQPEISFDHHGIHSDNTAREKIKSAIREKFDTHKRSYSVELVEQPIEAYKYIKPTEINGNPVIWWL